ncbi:MAG: DEAD/DEAH box helicase, partial [Candidatus Kerfeldbacteria bacterium]|nr:DEAD/DEAH box helicase [Candidatus Kerfeldbacteria bacterium]
MTDTHENFSGLGIAPSLLQALSQRGLKTPTPIQAQSIPAGLAGQDVVGIAQT